CFICSLFRQRLSTLFPYTTLFRSVEFDLEAMMDGEIYADFVLLWLLCHQSRVEGERPSDCWLEKWMKAAEEQGTRALDQLRDGRSEEHTSELQSRDNLVCRLLLEK